MSWKALLLLLLLLLMLLVLLSAILPDNTMVPAIAVLPGQGDVLVIQRKTTSKHLTVNHGVPAAAWTRGQPLSTLAVCRLVRPGGQLCLVGLTNGDTPLSKLASGKPFYSCHVYNVQPPGEQVCTAVANSWLT